MQKLCSQCSAPITCLQESGCWCAELPNVLAIPDDPAKGCLCRDCLTKKIEWELVSRGKSGEVASGKKRP